MKTLTIRMNASESAKLENVMNSAETLKTGSKTLIRCLEEFLPLNERIRDLEFALENANNKILAYELLLKNKLDESGDSHKQLGM